MLEVRSLEIPDIKIIQTERLSDARGYFCETFQRSAFAEKGILVDFVQDNQSSSDKVGTVRGLHFQLPPATQGKLVRVLQGSVYDVAVDLRVGSPCFGRWAGVTLTAADDEQLFVPPGFAHGFCTFEPNTVVAYKVDEFYAPASDSGLIWNDPTLAIDWPVAARDAVLSDKDQKHGRFADFKSPFSYAGP